MANLLDLVAREVAIALRDDGVRRTVYDALHASPYPEHKLHFRTFLSTNGSSLLRGMAAVRRITSEAMLSTVDSIVDLEFYMPVKEHWAKWDGGSNLLVVNDLSDDDEILPSLFDLSGNPVGITSEDEPPATPTLSLVRAETDFSRPPTGPSGAQRATEDAGPGIYMLSSYIDDLHEPWPSGSPEIEVHAFVRNGAGNFIDLQCAGEHQSTPFAFDQQDHSYAGPEVEVIPEDGVATNPIEVSVWEDDRTACDPSSGRPPRVSSDDMDEFIAWGSRPTVTVSLVNSVKVVSYATLGVPMALNEDTTIVDHDDQIGEARVPTCFPSSGGTYFSLYYSAPSHAWNGNVRLDHRFGQRDPACPPPSFSVSVNGPSSGQAFEQVTVTAIPANYISPVHYAWTIDGVAACGDVTQCTGYLGGEGTYTAFAVTAIDGAGSIASGSRSIFAEYSGCPGCNAPGQPSTSSGRRPESGSVKVSVPQGRARRTGATDPRR